MPAKKSEAKPKVSESAPDAAPEPGSTRTGVDIPPADREVLSRDIDSRMASLLKDHQAMGVRPK